MNLKQLSAHLGLSQATVSRALNGYPEVAETTRARVMRAAEEVGYIPNHAARRLATGVAGALGYVMPIEAAAPSDPHVLEVLAGAGEFAAEAGFDIHLCPTRAASEFDAYRRLAATRQVDGLLVACASGSDPRFPLLEALDLPFVLHGRVPGGSSCAYLDIDNRGAFRDATRLLTQLGHRRIGMLNGPRGMTFADDREAGVRDALEAAGAPIDPALFREAQMTESDGYRLAAEVLSADPPPTALLCSSIIMALGAVRALGERGLMPGRDISLIAHDDVFPYLTPENFRVPLTTTRSSLRTAGRRLAERLAARIRGDEVGPQGEVWQAELIVRGSTGPAPA